MIIRRLEALFGFKVNKSQFRQATSAIDKFADNANTAIDTVQITVYPSGSNNAPHADAGPDQVLPSGATTVTLVGSGQDVDGTITAFSWSQTAVSIAASPEVRLRRRSRASSGCRR